MLKTAVGFSYLALYLTSTLPALRRAERLKTQGREEDRRRILNRKAYGLVNSLSTLLGITYDIKGKENIPDCPVLYAANHQGIFDALVMLVKMREPCGFLIKKEAASIPILSRWMREMGCVFVDRQNPREAVKAVSEGVEIIKSGRSLVVFPEGKRSRSSEIGEFKNGAFKIAQRAGCPVVPVLIDGTYKIWEERKRLRKAKIKIRILPFVEVKSMSREEFKSIAPKVRQMIEEAKENV
ncbi:MAG: 1-acyl-sn-glycerol-3-phosphate acyltransferase [Clostridiales bacterium]|nr:1-acyl-sn-glycerol-3-phosphate acyltransferase [Clostridiales bacterium]